MSVPPPRRRKQGPQVTPGAATEHLPDSVKIVPSASKVQSLEHLPPLKSPNNNEHPSNPSPINNGRGARNSEHLPPPSEDKVQGASHPPPKKLSITNIDDDLMPGRSALGTEGAEAEQGSESFDGIFPGVWLSRYDNSYWMQAEDGGIAKANETQIKRCLRMRDLASTGDSFLNEVFHKHMVDFVGPLAGYSLGERRTDDGKLILVTEEPRIIQPREDYSNSMIWDFVELLFGEDEAILFHAWFKLERERFLRGDLGSGQALIMAGKRDLGKSLLILLIKEMLSGRAADPTDYLMGKTTFNAHLFGSELLVMDDKGGNGDYKTRKQLGDGIKQLVSGAIQQCHPKNRTPFTITPFWSIVIAVNEEPEELQVLPPMSEGIRDKLIILRAIKCAVTESVASREEKRAYWHKLVAAIPAYLHWSKEWTIPKEYMQRRFGLKHYANPTILARISMFSPELRLLHMMQEVLPIPWAGKDHDENTNNDGTRRVWTAREIENELKRLEDTSREAHDLLRGPGSCGKYLARLAREYPQFVRTKGRERQVQDGRCVGQGSVQYEVDPKGNFPVKKAE